ncbi:MAG: hypothetical protein JNK79_02575 [Chitinophagaceae bacterium]|nr:hypothetical protein [Chitinophagaceae bacterium]
MSIDYQKLLIKYMLHLKDVEDTFFLELMNTPFSANVTFTAEELQALRKIEEDIVLTPQDAPFGL